MGVYDGLLNTIVLHLFLVVMLGLVAGVIAFIFKAIDLILNRENDERKS